MIDVMMATAALLAAAPTLAAPPLLPLPLPARAAVRDEPIAMTSKSWGKTLSNWQIEPDGSIRYDYAVESKENSGAPEDFMRYTLVTKRTPPSPPRYRWIADLLKPVRASLVRPLPCEIRITDMPYGEVTWGEAPSATSMTYNTGCRETETRALVSRLVRAREQIAIWTKAAPIAATQDIRPAQ